MPRRNEEPAPQAEEPTPTEGEEPVRYDMPNQEAVRWDEGEGPGPPDATDPVVSSIAPPTLVAGGGATSLSVSGSGFDADAQVEADQTALPTTYVGPDALTAEYTPPAAAGTVTVTVRNVGTGLESNGAPLEITAVE